MSFTYKYPRPAITVDAAIFRKSEDAWRILLIKRKHPPYERIWALPGGFVNMDETLETAAARELQEETGIEVDTLQQLKAYSAINRDPRYRTISIVFTGILNKFISPVAADDAAKAGWFRIEQIPSLAFDHTEIVHDAMNWLLSKYQ